MKRRTLDVLFSAGGLALAGLLLVLGLVMTSNANFAKNYVAEQLSQQKITFKTAETLTAEERESLPRQVRGPAADDRQASRVLRQRLHRPAPQSTADGKTYAELGDPDRSASPDRRGDQDANVPTLPALQKQLTDTTAQRETLFKGETLRGLLLTSFGFSVFGVKGEQAATVAYIAAACWRSCRSPA